MDTSLIDYSKYDHVIEGKTFTSALSLKGHEWDNTLIINCTFKGSSGDGITLEDVDNVTIANNTITDVEGTGIRLTWYGSTDSVTIIDNYIANTGKNGISAGQKIDQGIDQTNLKIIGNTIDNTGLNGGPNEPDHHGMYIQATDFYIADNYVTDSVDGNGISVRSTGVIENNMVIGSGKSGIAYYADHYAGASETLTIKNNYVSDSGNLETVRNDIDLLGVPTDKYCAENFVITGNTITDTSSGVKVHSDYSRLGAKVTVSDNSVVSMSQFDSLEKSWLAAGYNDPLTSGTGGGTPTQPTNGTITGTAGADTLMGTSGNDSIDGGAGRDTINGGAGNDTLKGGADGDTFVIVKGNGSDTITDFYYQYSDVIRLENYGLTSFDQVKPLLTQSGSDTVVKFANGETLTLKNVAPGNLAADDFTFSNATAEPAPTPTPTPTPTTGQKITGTSGADKLTGTSGNDTLEGGAGKDTLAGGAGDDILTGGADGDTFVITKGQGNDTITDFYYQYSDVIHIEEYGLTSFSQIKSLMTQSGADTVVKFANGETLTLKNVTATNLAADDFVFKNTVTHQTINGTDAADNLLGGAGNDTLSGGNGKDTLDGGAGNDVLTGGRDGDTFVITKGQGSDTITDFYAQYSDVVRLVNHGYTSFTQVKSALTQSGADTVLKFSNGETLTLKNVAMSDLAADDFTFQNSTSLTGLSTTSDSWA